MVFISYYSPSLSKQSLRALPSPPLPKGGGRAGKKGIVNFILKINYIVGA